jgi:outer membrane murein-binding lipoprotein Lpp
MTKSPARLTTWCLAAAAAGALLVGCSSSEAKLPKDEVANTVAEKLAAQTGQPKPDVSCPKDLEGKVGTTMRCKLTAQDGSSLGVTVKVTSVDGNDIKYDIKADG